MDQLTDRVRLVFSELIKNGKIRTNRDFFKPLSISDSVGSQILSEKGGRKFPSKRTQTLIDVWNVSETFLQNGKLPIICANNDSDAHIITDTPQTIDLPLISVNARASFDYDTFTDSSQLQETAPVYKIRVKGLKKPVLIDIDGDSMGDQLKPNTRVLGDEIDPNDWQYITGVVAVVFNKQFVVKRIRENKSVETNTITLYSDNPLGGTFTVKVSDIKIIWKIIEIVKSKVV